MEEEESGRFLLFESELRQRPRLPKDGAAALDVLLGFHGLTIQPAFIHVEAGNMRFEAHAPATVSVSRVDVLVGQEISLTNAVQTFDPKVVAVALAAGADLEEPTFYGTPLGSAIPREEWLDDHERPHHVENALEIMDMLRKAGANLDPPENSLRGSFLWRAVNGRIPRAVKWFLDAVCR